MQTRRCLTVIPFGWLRPLPYQVEFMQYTAIFWIYKMDIRVLNDSNNHLNSCCCMWKVAFPLNNLGAVVEVVNEELTI